MRADLADRGRWGAHQATTFAGEVVLGSPMRDVTADALLAYAVVDRGIDLVYAGVEYSIEDGFGLDLAEMQRRDTMAAHIEPCSGASVGVTQEDDGLVADTARRGRSESSSDHAPTYQAFRTNMAGSPRAHRFQLAGTVTTGSGSGEERPSSGEVSESIRSAISLRN
jgi:hypothetical protein